MYVDRLRLPTAALLVGLAVVAGPLLPSWLLSIATIALANGLVVLGLVILWRAGVVPFGQGLFYATGAYAVALAARSWGIRDAFAGVALGALAAGGVAVVVGFVLARYREIFFAMLSLAVSMILYGTLVKTASLGSTDGFNVEAPTYAGFAPALETRPVALYLFTVLVVVIGTAVVGGYLRSVSGALAMPIRENEIRVEYLGASVTRLLHLGIVVAGVLAGAGGSLAALAIGHVDPSMSYWTTSGGFVFVTILAGAGSIVAPFVGSLVFELLRTGAMMVAPTMWQAAIGAALLTIIIFLPGGISSLRLRRRPAEGRAT